MSVHLITGQGTTDHITSSDAGSLHAGIVGTGRYVLNRGNKFTYEVVSNNLVKVKDGDLLNQGRHMNIAVNDYEECTIENGLQSVKRNDLIVIRYEKNTETEIETASVVVIKGTSGDTAVDPAYTTGNILGGDPVDDFPLYRVRLNGINIEGIDTMFAVQKSIKNLDESLGNTDISGIGDGSVTGAIRMITNTIIGDLSALATTVKSSVIGAINSLALKLDIHMDNSTIHITASERTTWNSKAAGSHTHDDRYYTETEINAKLSSMYVTRTLTAGLDVAASGTMTVNFTPPTIAGYTCVGTTFWSTGSTSLFFAKILFDGTSLDVAVRNNSSSAISSGTMSIGVLYLKTSF